MSKSSTQESSTPRKVKHAECEGQLEKKSDQGQSLLEENHDLARCSPEVKGEIEQGNASSSSCCNGSNLASSNPGTRPAEVIVEG